MDPETDVDLHARMQVLDNQGDASISAKTHDHPTSTVGSDTDSAPETESEDLLESGSRFFASYLVSNQVEGENQLEGESQDGINGGTDQEMNQPSAVKPESSPFVFVASNITGMSCKVENAVNSEVNMMSNNHQEKNVTKVQQNEKRFGCELCPYRAKRRQHIKSHMVSHKRRQFLLGEAGKIKCPKCDYSHDDQFYVNCHIILHHEGAEHLICPHCDFSSRTTYRLQKHVNSVHNKVKNFACNLCDYRCAEKGSLKIHVRIVHERVKSYKCHHCDFAAYVGSHLNYHVRSKHEGRFDFRCDECDKAFVDTRAVRSHKSAVHAKDKKFKCPIYDYCANRNQHIKVHMKTHLGTFTGTVVEAEDKRRRASNKQHERSEKLIIQ